MDLQDDIAQLNRKVDRLLVLSEYVAEKVNRHDLLLYGEQGLVVRVDRLEQTSKQHRWTLGILISSFGGAVVELMHKFWS